VRWSAVHKLILLALKLVAVGLTGPAGTRRASPGRQGLDTGPPHTGGQRPARVVETRTGWPRAGQAPRHDQRADDQDQPGLTLNQETGGQGWTVRTGGSAGEGTPVCRREMPAFIGYIRAAPAPALTWPHAHRQGFAPRANPDTHTDTATDTNPDTNPLFHVHRPTP